ncbi:MAG TPA: LPS export ABC transporter permease LptG [Stellaceae bacterium]|jgi:lipopolysaccharide export system permease protein|nr:LPS export ABC transporter permease LptG [Stellaceae bacterium]
MSPWKTLFRYIARQFFTWCTIIFLAMVSIVFLLDYIELIRRAGTRPDATLLVLLEMAALKQPDMMQQVMPFAILFGTMMAFWRLTRSHELVVARAAGISAWQFLAPPLSGAFLVGVLVVTVFNPIASVMQAAYEQLDNRILRGGGDQLSLSRSGFWLRQSDDSGNHSVVHAKGFSINHSALDDVMILFLAGDTKLARRIDASQAELKNGVWEVHDGTEWEPGKPLMPFTTMDVDTNLTLNKIQESFAAPETMSFWELPGFIRLLDASGFSSQKHRLYFNALLARPFLYAAMVLIAASFSLRMQRRGGATLMIGAGVACGFALYFLSDVVFALGLSASIPISLAAWTPTGVTWLLGATLLLHLEDG